MARSVRARERACSVFLSPDECPATSPSADLRRADSPGMPSGVMGTVTRDAWVRRLRGQSIWVSGGRPAGFPGVEVPVVRGRRARLPARVGQPCCNSIGESSRNACRGGGEPVRLSSSDGPAQPFRRPAAGLFEMPTPRVRVARAGGVGDQVPGGRSSVTPPLSSPMSQTIPEFQPPVIHGPV